MVKDVNTVIKVGKMFGEFLKWIAIPFVLSTVYFGLRKGENDYYDTDKYD